MINGDPNELANDGGTPSTAEAKAAADIATHSALYPAPPPGLRIPRTEQLLGCRLDELSVAVIDRLVAERAAEDESLDFKRSRYEDNAKGLYEVAKDVAALANAGGGLIILGVVDSRDCADRTRPVQLSPMERQRMQHSVTVRVQPWIPDFYLGELAIDPERTRGYYLLAVPASDMAPHSVLTKAKDGATEDETSASVWPVRVGSHTEWMREPQIAARYRDRTEAVQRQDRRLEEAASEGATKIDTAAACWLSLSVAPSRPGRGIAEPRAADRVRDWFRDLVTTGQRFPTAFTVGAAAVGRRRVVLSDTTPDRGFSRSYRLEFHADGSGFAAIALGFPPPKGPAAFPRYQAELEQEPAQWVQSDVVEAWTVSLLGALSHHAVHAGAGGDLAVQAQLTPMTWPGLRPWPEPDRSARMEPPPLAITEARMIGGIREHVRVTASARLSAPTPASATVPLTVTVDDGDLVSAAAGLVADLLGEFAVSTPRLLRQDGTVDATATEDVHASLLSWAQTRCMLATDR